MTDKQIPAFPRPAVFTQVHGLASIEQDGMTLRDYFAAKAMAVIMPSVVTELQKRSYSEDKVQQLRDAAAGACYGMADAMLKARTE